MTEAAPFLEAIRDAEVTDDAPRLVFADWLDERGDPLGEFIRVEVALARMGRDDPRREELFRRDCEMIRTHKERWGVGVLRGGATHWDFRRGLLDEVTMGIDSFLEHHERLFRSVPILTLHLGRQGPVGVAAVGQLLKVHSLGRLRELTLDLSGLQLGDSRAAALAFSP